MNTNWTLNGVEMPMPGGGGNPGKDLHSAAFFSKVGAFSGILQVLQNQRTNQLLEGQILLQGHVQLQAQLSELRNEIKNQIELHVNFFTDLKKTCDKAIHTYLGSELSSELESTFEEIRAEALDMHERLEELISMLDNVETPEDIEEWQEVLGDCASAQDEFAPRAVRLIRNAAMICDHSDFANTLNVIKDKCEKLADEIRTIFRDNSYLIEYFEKELEELENYPEIYNESINVILSNTNDLKEMWSNIDENFIKSFYQGLQASLDIMTRQEKFLISFQDRINAIRDNSIAYNNNESNARKRKSSKSRLKELQNLFDEGLISNEEYQSRREQILSEL